MPCDSVRSLKGGRLNGGYLAVLHSENLTLVDGLTVNGAVSRGESDKTGRDFLGGFHHVHVILLNGEVIVNIEHGGDTLRYRAGVQNTDIALRERVNLLRGHDNVFVVGQDENMFCRGCEHSPEQVIRARIHRLTSADYLIHSELCEQFAQTVAGSDRNIAEWLCRLSGLLRLLLLLGRITPLGVLMLLTHVFNFDIDKLTEFKTLLNGIAGLIRVDMNLDNLLVVHNDHAVAYGLEICAKLARVSVSLAVGNKFGAIGESDIGLFGRLRRHCEKLHPGLRLRLLFQPPCR